MAGYNSHENYARNKWYLGRRNGKFGGRNYANGYRNWSQNPNYGGKYNPRADNGKRGYYKPRKEPFNFVREPPFKNNKQKRKGRPQRVKHLQRPQPPRPANDFDEDYYFPEEAIKSDTKHEFEIGFPRPKKKRRNPGDVEKILKRPESKIPYHGEKFGNQYKQKIRDPTTSYSSFVQHPSNEYDDYDDEVDPPEYAQVKTKKKRVKKKTNPRKKNKDNDYYSPYLYEQNDSSEKYPPYFDNEPPEKNFKKNVRKPYYEVKDEEEANYTPKQRPTAGGQWSAEDNYNEYIRHPKHPDPPQYNPNYSQQWSQVVTPRPIPQTTGNGYQPQQFLPNQYNYQNRDYSSLQQSQLINTNNQQPSYYSTLDSYKSGILNNNYANSNPAATLQKPTANAYNSYSNTYPPYSNMYTDSITQNGIPGYGGVQSSQNSYAGGIYVKNQNLSYLDNSQKYGDRLSYQHINSKSQDENDFIKNHQNLYHKGVSGIPIQGDGYGKESFKKDYDIGYGDFQFDENPTS